MYWGGLDRSATYLAHYEADPTSDSSALSLAAAAALLPSQLVARSAADAATDWAAAEYGMDFAGRALRVLARVRAGSLVADAEVYAQR